MVYGTGLVLAPGFIDVNCCNWLSQSAALLKLKDGITTCFVAHGDMFNANASVNHASELLNYATSVGLIPAQMAHLSDHEMFAAIEKSLRFGAYTIALSPEYNSKTTPEVISSLGDHFANKNILFTFHLRYSSRKDELRGLQEAIECAQRGVPVHILHISSTGATFHPEEACQMIDKAVQGGANITFDFYPYTGWSSSIHRARFDGDWLQRYETDMSHVHVGDADPLTLEQFVQMSHDPVQRNVNVDSIPQLTVDYFALKTFCPIGTDSPGDVTTVHPRGVGSFTKFLNDYVDTGKIPLSQALYRLSTQAANQFSPYIPDLKNRGSIEVGKAADLILWNPTKIKSRATYANPHEPSDGVIAAFVNGIPVILGGKVEEPKLPPGHHLKGAWAKQ